MAAPLSSDHGRNKGPPNSLLKFYPHVARTLDDAACLLAFRQELKLTPERVQKLQQTVKESRQEAAAILTPEQQKTLAEVAGQPASMNAMHAKMHEMMMQKMESAGPKTTEEKAKKKPEGAGSNKK